ncbi:disease resistance TIR-NBS-LRR class family protein, partial [Tanacetum coccineum]
MTPEASTSTSSIQKRFKYDVFLSFKGEETRNTFVGHLYEALKQKGIQTFKDDERMKQRKTIDNHLIQAIKDSRFFIIVFSENYASSSWCLDELVEIMDCQKTSEQTAYPVFFNVEPTEIRKQSGAFGEAFSENKKKDTAGKWIEALKGASNLVGRELQATANGNEAEFIKKVVGEISLELRSINSGFDENLVGMETRVKAVVSSLELDIDEVRIIGIKGMGGIGKTTTARAVFDHISADFEAISFVGNVREVSNGSVSGLRKLQEQVLSKVLNEHVTLDSVDDGKNMMKRRMCGIKVLLVLDDVDHIEQLKVLAGDPKWFKPGSRILITTRDEQVLVAHRVNAIHDIVLLSEQEAISLFRENPLQGYEELSRKIVRYAAGLPLTLEVLGSSLCGKDELEWVDAIDRLKRIPLKDTLEKLELSYISLEDEYKEIFLDIACILKGEVREDAIRVLESCGFHARIGLRVLEQRSLITYSEFGELGMHDHIEEMGKNIVRRSHPDEPNKHSRLWIYEEIEDILVNDMGSEETKCLRLDMWRGNSRILMKGLGKMKKLRYLKVNNDGRCLRGDPKLNDINQYFPNSLKILECTNYPFLYLPKTFQANNLVRLELERSEIVQLWEDGEKKVLKKFNYLNISHSKLRTFDLGLTPNLKTLSLVYCVDFVELHVSVSVSCPNLKSLNLRGSRLRSLDLELIPNLERLYLEDCDELVEINAPIGCLRKLVYLNLNGCLRFTNFEVHVLGWEPKVKSSAALALYGMSLDLCPLHPNSNLLKFQFDCHYEEHLPSSVGNIEKLISFGLCACSDFKKFSDTICSLCFLKKLKLKGDFPEFPKDFGLLECLEELQLSSTNIKHLPDSICMLKHLKCLKVKNAHLLEKLPQDLGRLEFLKKLYVSSKKIEYLPDSICMLKRLKSLDVLNCCRLGKLPEDIGQLESLERLDLLGTTIKHLPNSI